MSKKADDAIRAIEMAPSINMNKIPYYLMKLYDDHGATILAALRLAKEAEPVEVEVRVEGKDMGTEWRCVICEQRSWKVSKIKHAPDCAWLAWKEATE